MLQESPTAQRQRSKRPLTARAFAHRAEEDGADSSDEAGDGEGGGASARQQLTPEERERKRLRRLLRNRASAQQARERKKHFLASIEERASEMEAAVEGLAARAQLLERENATLRMLLRTATEAPAAQPHAAQPETAEESAEQPEHGATAEAAAEPLPVCE